jgi:nitroreductase
VITNLLSDAALMQASSPKIFERGKTYASAGAVSILGEEKEPGPAIHAAVAGTKTYATDVWIEDGGVAGSCDCPDGAEGWFCKHQVAAALVWRSRLSGTELTVDEAARKKIQASAKRAQTVENRRKALEEFLRSQPAPVLAEKLIDLAESYHEIARELQAWQLATRAQPEDLKPLVSEILAPGRQFIPLHEVPAYIRAAAAVLPVLQRERARDATAAAALSLHALRRAWAAMMHADDSNGEIGDLSRAIATEWIAALKGAGAQPPSFGDTYLRAQLEDPFGCFDERAAEGAMGAAALGRYRSVLAAEWRQAKDAVLALKAARPARGATRRRRAVDWLQRDESETRLGSLERLHLAQLECAGDVDGVLSVLREDLSEAHKFGAVTSFLERSNRLREAFSNAERGCKTFPDDRRLQEDLLRCYERDGWTAEAYALRRRQFDAEPSVERFHETLKAGIAANKDAAALRQELLREIAERELSAMRQNRPSLFSEPNGIGRAPARDVSLRAQILCFERAWGEACALVQPPAACNPIVLRHIALNLDASRREGSVALLLRVFTHAMRTASSPYRSELDLVSEIAERLDATRRSTWLAELGTQFKAKRNFVRDLPKL